LQRFYAAAPTQNRHEIVSFFTLRNKICRIAGAMQNYTLTLRDAGRSMHAGEGIVDIHANEIMSSWLGRPAVVQGARSYLAQLEAAAW
jgi:hypothetical protein